MIDLGDTVALAVAVTDTAGAAANASTITLTITLPDGTTTSPAVTNPPAVTGQYRVDYVPVQAGRHLARWTTTGPATAYTDQFDVRSTTPGLVISLAAAKAHLQLPASVSTFDEEVRDWLEAATEVVELVSGRVVARRTVVERRDLAGRERFALHSTPVVSLTSVVDVNGLNTWSTTAGFRVDAETGIVDVLLGTAPPSGPTILTYVAGPLVVPARYSGAAKMILRHLWTTQRAQLGGQARKVAASPTDDVVTVAGYSVPRAAVELIGDALPGIA